MNPTRTLFALALVATLSGCGSNVTPTATDSTLDTTPPAAPTSLRVASDPSINRSTLTWDPSAAADLAGYEVWVDATGTGAFTLAGQGGTESFVLPVASSVADLDYRVRAFDQTGNRSAYSNTYAVQLRPASTTGEPGDNGDQGNGRLDP